MNWYKKSLGYLDIGHGFYPGNELWIMELKNNVLKFRSEPISMSVPGHGRNFPISEEAIATGRLDAKKGIVSMAFVDNHPLFSSEMGRRQIESIKSRIFKELSIRYPGIKIIEFS